MMIFFFFNDTATTEIYTLSLHDALPIFVGVDEERDRAGEGAREVAERFQLALVRLDERVRDCPGDRDRKSHTSELQSRQYLVCRLLLEKKNSCDPRPYART